MGTNYVATTPSSGRIFRAEVYNIAAKFNRTFDHEKVKLYTYTCARSAVVLGEASRQSENDKSCANAMKSTRVIN